MKKSILFLLLSTILVLASCGKNDTSTESSNNQKKQEKTLIKEQKIEESKIENSWDTVEKLNTTMLEIFKSWKTATCTFKMTNEGATFDAIMYIDWKKISYTMSWDIGWQKMVNNSIMKDWFSYSWSNISKDAFKMKEDLSEDENSWNEEAPMEAEEMNQKVDFECKNWVDSSKFELPTDINFQDMWAIPQMPMWN